MKKPQLKTIASQPSWVLSNDDVALAVAQLGGHVAPVAFYRKTSRPIQPYYISPWQGENLKISEPVLRPLRGDFFCMPFGANAKVWRGEQHSCHGETATRKWTLKGIDSCGPVSSIAMAMKTSTRPGKVTKTLSIIAGQNVVYCQHLLEGFSGPMPLGHHATLAMPEKEGSMRLATSAIKFGMTNPTDPGDPATGNYSSAMPGQRFSSLSRVPLIWSAAKYGDFSAFPARRGFTDIIAILNRTGGKNPAWTTATSEEGYMWFSLKDPGVLPATVMWVANRGQHGPPWNGRNCCLGLEDVCGFFADGLSPSAAANVLTRAGVPTAVKLSKASPTMVNYIHGVVRVPKSFKRVRRVSFEPGKVTFTSVAGKRVTAAVNHDFIKTGSVEQ